MPYKIASLFRSRKFWSLMTALVGLAGAVQTGRLDMASAVNNAIIALAAYSLATGIEDSGQG